MTALRTAFFYIYIACTLGANAVLLIPVDALGNSGDNTIFSLSWVLLHMISVLVLLTSRSLRAVPVLIAVGIGGLIVLSAAWSVAWMDSLVYGMMAAGNILTACVLASERSLPDIAKMMLRVLTVMVLAGMLGALIGYGQVFDVDPHARPNYLGSEPIRGFFAHNIMAGFFSATGAVLAMTLLRGIRRILVLAAFILFVLWAGSATGFLLAVAGIIIVPLAQLIVPRVPLGGLLAVGTPIGLLAAAVVSQIWVPVVELVGRDPTLTGRTLLWEWGFGAITERPVLGWGFFGYFNSEYGALPSRYTYQFWEYDIPHFHNSYVQTGVDLGLLGLLILLFVLSYTTATAYLYASSATTQTGVRTGIALLMVMVTFLIASPTEVIFVTYNHFGTFGLFAMFFGLMRHRQEQRYAPRRQEHSGPLSLTVGQTPACTKSSAGYPRH